MSKPETLTKLRELHDELAKINEGLTAADDIDEPTIDTLGQMMSDVSMLFDEFEESGSRGTDSPVHGALIGRIKGFESDHPRIVRFLSQLTDIMAMIGV